jgi:malate dehydrogenase (decarboxylating)
MLFLLIYHYTRRIREITQEVAAAVVREAVAENIAEGYRDMDARELARLSEVINHLTTQSRLYYYEFLLLYLIILEQCMLQEETVDYVKNNMWNPVYPTVVYKRD